LIFPAFKSCAAASATALSAALSSARLCL
jgi:hypothetical protein